MGTDFGAICFSPFVDDLNRKNSQVSSFKLFDIIKNHEILHFFFARTKLSKSNANTNRPPDYGSSRPISRWHLAAICQCHNIYHIVAVFCTRRRLIIRECRETWRQFQIGVRHASSNTKRQKFVLDLEFCGEALTQKKKSANWSCICLRDWWWVIFWWVKRSIAKVLTFRLKLYLSWVILAVRT